MPLSVGRLQPRARRVGQVAVAVTLHRPRHLQLRIIAFKTTSRSYVAEQTTLRDSNSEDTN
jgi:hypothetical protein